MRARNMPESCLRLGIVGSSGGSALASAVTCLQRAHLPLELVVVTDRNCGMLEWARHEGHEAVLFPYESARAFSALVVSHLLQRSCTASLLFYTRRLAQPLIGTMPVFNIHPSLLPAFPGLRAVQDAIDSSASTLGATLHAVDDDLDTGPIIAQIATGLPIEGRAIVAPKISYMQKVYLTLLLYELITTYGLTLSLTTHRFEFAKPPPFRLPSLSGLTHPGLQQSFFELQEAEACAIA